MAQGPVKVSADASGETPAQVATTTKNGETALDLTPEQLTSPIDTTSSSKQLPANQYKGEINWLGSSYTGQDIKVVAHLYDDASEDIKNLKQQLEERQAYLNAIISGAAALSSPGVLSNIFTSGADFDDIKKAVELSMNLDSSSEGEQAKRTLLNIVIYSRPQSTASLVSALKSLSRNAKTELTNISQRLKNLETLSKDAYSTVVLGTLQTLSVQSAREKYAVRSLGHAYAKAYTRGTRTLAGSMIFTIFEEHPLSKLIRAMGNSKRWSGAEISTLLPDQIPPIDITIVFANEYGSISEQRLYGVEFVNDSATYSIENLLSEQVMQFTCRDIDIMTSKGLIKLSAAQRLGDDVAELSGSRLMSNNEEYLQYLQRLGIRRRLTNR